MGKPAMSKNLIKVLTGFDDSRVILSNIIDTYKNTQNTVPLHNNMTTCLNKNT